MIREKMEYEFLGFDPKYEIKNMIAALAERVYFSAPGDSAIKWIFEKSQGMVKASCRIASMAGIFSAEATAKSPSFAIQKLEKRIHSQLNAWKVKRFNRPL